MTNSSKIKIVLASASIGRSTLMKQLGLPFQTMISNINEEVLSDPDSKKQLLIRARAKAEEIVERIAKSVKRKENHHQNTSRLIPNASRFLVVAADSEAILDGKTYGKVRNKEEAKEMVRELMGKTHDFVTATSIILIKDTPCRPARSVLAKSKWEDITATRVTLRSMNDVEIEEYTSRYDFTRFAACYTLNETPWDWVTRIDGSYTNVIGLPFEVVLPIFRKLKLLK